MTSQGQRSGPVRGRMPGLRASVLVGGPGLRY